MAGKKGTLFDLYNLGPKLLKGRPLREFTHKVDSVPVKKSTALSGDFLDPQPMGMLNYIPIGEYVSFDTHFQSRSGARSSIVSLCMNGVVHSPAFRSTVIEGSSVLIALVVDRSPNTDKPQVEQLYENLVGSRIGGVIPTRTINYLDKFDVLATRRVFLPAQRAVRFGSVLEVSSLQVPFRFEMDFGDMETKWHMGPAPLYDQYVLPDLQIGIDYCVKNSLHIVAVSAGDAARDFLLSYNYRVTYY